MSADQTVDEEVPRVREAYLRGVPPSQIVEALLRRGWGNIMLIMLGMRAFGLALREGKGAEGISAGGRIEAPVFDAYFIPLIERNRASWDGSAR